MTLSRRSLWFRTVSPVRFEIPARAASRSSKLITNLRGNACPIKSRNSLPRVAQLGARDLASPRAKSLTPKQQLFTILSLLLQNMESALGQFVGDDVVTDHLAPSSLVPFQLALVIAAHFRIATHRVHGCLRERCFQIMIALLAGPPAPRDVTRLGDAGDYATVRAEDFHVSKACQFAYFIQNSEGDGLAHTRQLEQQFVRLLGLSQRQDRLLQLRDLLRVEFNPLQFLAGVQAHQWVCEPLLEFSFSGRLDLLLFARQYALAQQQSSQTAILTGTHLHQMRAPAQ